MTGGIPHGCNVGIYKNKHRDGVFSMSAVCNEYHQQFFNTELWSLVFFILNLRERQKHANEMLEWLDLLPIMWYNNEKNGCYACMRRHLTSISIETLVEMV